MFTEVDVGDTTRLSTAEWSDLPLLGLLSCSQSEARGIIATTLAAQLTAEQGSKSCGDDKTSACRKTIQSDSSKEAPFNISAAGGAAEHVAAWEKKEKP